MRYQAGQTKNTRAPDAALILRAKKFSIRQLMRESGKSQHAVERFLRGARLHPSTGVGLEEAVEKLEREAQCKTCIPGPSGCVCSADYALLRGSETLPLISRGIGLGSAMVEKTKCPQSEDEK